MRFHVIGLPHCPTTREHSACAYTAKNFKFCKMMYGLGHEVIHYGVEGSNPTCVEHVTTLTTADMKRFFGGHDYTKDYYPIVWDSNLPYWQISNANAAFEVRRRAHKKDFVCVLGGACHQPLCNALADKPVMPVEYGIGYFGTFAKHRVFESYAHMHHVYGRGGNDPDGQFFDAIIPNYFQLEDFTFQEQPSDYFLFVGRMIRRKGLEIAIEATRRAGVKLLLAGQGAKQEGSKIKIEDQEYDAPHVELIGYLDPDRRNEIMGKAIALLAPTLYLEPFGGVAVEAQLCGTPAITTDWGAFPETVLHGSTGYRCRTIEQFVWAIRHAGLLDRKVVSDRARNLYSLQTIGKMYEEYFGMLLTLWDEGFWETPGVKNQRMQLDWLSKETWQIKKPA